MTANNTTCDKQIDLLEAFWNTSWYSQSLGSNGLAAWIFVKVSLARTPGRVTSSTWRLRVALQPTSHAPRISDLSAIVVERGLTGLGQPSGCRGSR
jgi:hypothetical protein